MKQHECRAGAVACLAFGVFVAMGCAQSLSDKLKEDENFYVNYGKELYAKLKIEKDVVGLYDGFGEHIVDGIDLYELTNESVHLSNDQAGLKDSVATSQAKEITKHDFFEKFANMVVTQDAIGGIKTSFLVGDQITTRFTPLTFDKVNFKGIRWDLWSSGLQFSAVLSRTSPGVLSRKEWDGTDSAIVEYPITVSSLDPSYYTNGIATQNDWTNKSTYGNYDFLWALHAENRIANKVDVGLTLINHHVNDIKRGWQPWQGNLPDSLMPNAVHFEFYDLTPADTNDAGVFVDNVTMMVNGRPVVPKSAFTGSFERAFTGDQDGILIPREIPLAQPQNGPVPVIVEFQVNPSYWQYQDNGSSLSGMSDIKKLSFKYQVAGNYQVFVSTDREIPMSVKGKINPQTNLVEYSYPTKQVGAIYDQGLKINAGTNPSVFGDERLYSTTYFGEYIAQSPRKIATPANIFAGVCNPLNKAELYANKEAYNYREYTYDYSINESDETYGVNFKGELGGVNFSGEVALNRSENMLPGSDESRKSLYKWAGSLKADRELGKHFGLSGEAYYIAPQWMTNLKDFQASQYFNQTTYHSLADYNKTTTAVQDPNTADYLVSGRPMQHNWNNIDVNADNDAFPESDRRHYPADLDAENDRYHFYKDGSLEWESGLVKSLTLPDGMLMSYDDPDGVVASKDDKNKNGIPDWREDFLLFQSDPPVFDLGIDLNNNGLPDYEDATITPNYGGHSVGYVITGDGITTQGIEGGTLNLRYTPFENTTLDIGGTYERLAENDIADSTTYQQDNLGNDMEGKSLVGYVTAKHEVLKRSQGLQYNLGLELRGIEDGLRNDAVQSIYQRFSDQYNVTYAYYLDPMSYRRAAVGNLVGGITYSNIRNFEYGFRFKVGGEQHFGLGDDQLFYSPDVLYGDQWKPYYSRSIAEVDLVNRIQYRLKFNPSYEESDWRSMFNFLDRLEIIPQYKVSYSNRDEFIGPDESQNDPRDLRTYMSLDQAHLGYIDTAIDIHPPVSSDSLRKYKSQWNIYSAAHTSYLLNVPIIKVNYKIAENTMFQLGLQWLRYLDFVSPENNALKFTTLAQVVSKANYKGYSVTFFVGGSWSNTHYDVNADDPVLQNGSLFNVKDYQVFAKLFSGI